MTPKEIELELRAEVKIEDFEKVLALFRKEAQTVEESSRLTIMFTGAINDKPLDIRVRIKKDKKAELVFKSGDFHSHDRLERMQPIDKTQIIGLVKCFSLLGMPSKITERDNYDFLLNDYVEVTLVRSKNICYVEFETKTTPERVEEEKEKISKIMDLWNFKPINKSEFDGLCERLGKFSDKTFQCSDQDIKYLESALEEY